MGCIHQPHLARAVAAVAALSAAAPGCADDPPDPGVAWVDSIRSPGDASACAAIGNADLAGECLAMAARELGQQDRFDEAAAICRSMVEGAWRHECFFLLSDERHSLGDEAHLLCSEAGRYRTQCLLHAMSRETHALLDGSPRGAEGNAYRQLTAVVERYVPGPRAKDRARVLMSNHLAGRDLGEPFGLVQCGTAPLDICRSAYCERVRLAAREDGRWRHLCPGPPTLESVQAAGLPAWSPAWAEQSALAWSELCSGKSEPGRPELRPTGR